MSEAAMGSKARDRSGRVRGAGAVRASRTLEIASFSVRGGGAGSRRLRARHLAAVDAALAMGL